MVRAQKGWIISVIMCNEMKFVLKSFLKKFGKTSLNSEVKIGDSFTTGLFNCSIFE